MAGTHISVFDLSPEQYAALDFTEKGKDPSRWKGFRTSSIDVTLYRPDSFDENKTPMAFLARRLYDAVEAALAATKYEPVADDEPSKFVELSDALNGAFDMLDEVLREVEPE